jgi:2-haloacid dehalogenase
MSRAKVVVFDVNETLSDMAPMGRRFAEVGCLEDTAKIWFASVLRDGFALAAAGASERFATIAEEALRDILAAPTPGFDMATSAVDTA